MPNPLIAQSKPIQLFPDFGKYLTYNEAVKSAEAIRRGLKNIPTAQQYANMVRAYNDFYVPICNQFGKLPVTSFFRSAEVNKAVGGSKTSAHMSGLAIDIDCDGLRSVSNKDLYQWVRKNLKFDQVITEFPDKNGNPSWIHIAHRANGPDRQQGMRAEKRGDGVIYIYE